MGHAWDCCAAAAAVKMHLQSYLWRTFARGWFFHEIVLVVFVSAGCRDYSQMWGIIRNNNNIITIVCFDSKKLLEPCRKFAPPQIPQYIYGVNYKTSNNNNNNSEPQHHHEKRHDHHWTWFLAIFLFPCTVSLKPPPGNWNVGKPREAFNSKDLGPFQTRGHVPDGANNYCTTR